MKRTLSKAIYHCPRLYITVQGYTTQKKLCMNYDVQILLHGRLSSTRNKARQSAPPPPPHTNFNLQCAQKNTTWNRHTVRTKCTEKRHEHESWLIVTWNGIRPFSSSENKVYGLGGEWQRFWQWERFPLRHFSCTPPPPPSTQQTSTRRLLLSLVIITRCLYKPVSVRLSYFARSQCWCSRTANEHGDGPILGT